MSATDPARDATAALLRRPARRLGLHGLAGGLVLALGLSLLLPSRGVANSPPTAAAGPDRTLVDIDQSGAESVTLDGSASSDAEGPLVLYAWSEAGVPLASGAVVSLELLRGSHLLTLTVMDEEGATDSDELAITVAEPSAPELLVAGLELARYAETVEALNDFGDRCRMSSCPGSPPNSFQNAQNWIEQELLAAGYSPERHFFTSSIRPGSNLYATRMGSVHPDQMYIVSAHLDGRGGGGAADDNASGSALVLEAARAFAAPGVETEVSIRFIWWDQEESGYLGSEDYVADRKGLRGSLEEPDWLGMISHDMLLFDHGVPVQPDQIPSADIDVEYRAGTRFANEARTLAETLADGAARYSSDYPAQVGSFSVYTDDTSFWDEAPAISVRENRRGSEIGLISGQPRIHPYYHSSQDVFENYSAADLALGFNALQMTVGTVAELAGASVAAVGACQDGIDNDGDGSIDLDDARDCRSAADPSEGPDCADGVDNDGDLASDLADPGCRGPTDFSEEPDCLDGLGNDGDGLIDFDGGAAWGLPPAEQTAPDPQCRGDALRGRETRGSACGLGFALALLLPLLMRRSRPLRLLGPAPRSGSRRGRWRGPRRRTGRSGPA